MSMSLLISRVGFEILTLTSCLQKVWAMFSRGNIAYVVTIIFNGFGNVLGSGHFYVV